MPAGGTIATLAQARDFLLSLPPNRHDETVAAATEALLMAAEGRGPILHANVGIGRVVHGAPKAAPRGKKNVKKYHIVR